MRTGDWAADLNVESGRREGSRGAEVDCSPLFWRARPVALGHPDPLDSEAGVGIRVGAPDGVIAMVERRSCA